MVYRPDNVDIVETNDGSHTLWDRDRDVRYRSMHGARDESNHVFVEGTRLVDRPAPWRVLELGFGAGVNFCETVRALHDRHPDGQLAYHTVDRAPVGPDCLSFHDGPAGRMARQALEALDLQAPRTVTVTGFDGRVTLHLHPMEWESFQNDELRADAVYFDPFGPRNEADSWTDACFEVAVEHMASDALLGTYSAASDVKRAMFRAGLEVATAPGPGRKREITFASPSAEALSLYEQLSRDRYL